MLISLLTAYQHGGWTLAEASLVLSLFFDRQYRLTEDVTTETRYDSDGQPYPWSVCTVTLDNFDLAHLTAYLLDEPGLQLYAGYMANQGNRPDLFPQDEYPNASGRGDYMDYDVPPEALEDETFAAMLKEAEKYLGYPCENSSWILISYFCSGATMASRDTPRGVSPVLRGVCANLLRKRGKAALSYSTPSPTPI